MIAGKNCPACSRDVGVWPVIRGSLITLSGNRFRCPHCETKLRYAGWGIDGVYTVLMGPVLVAILLTEYRFIPWYETGRLIGFGVGWFILLSAPMLLASALYMRRRGVLVTEPDRAPDPGQLPSPR